VLSFHLVKRFASFFLDAELETSAQRLVLFGPSGSGKSLTLLCLAGLMRPDRGFVKIGGHDLFDRDRRLDVPPERRRIGYVPQSGALFPHLTLASNVGYGLRRLPAAERDARVDQLLRLVRLEGFGSRLPDQLSGGEQQRGALARALAVEPELLLLDEPFSALDRPVRELLRQELLELQEQLGIAWVFVTHDLEEAYLLADEIAVYGSGSILQSGSRDEVFYRPRTLDVAHLVGVRNIIPVVAIAEERVRVEGTNLELAIQGGAAATQAPAECPPNPDATDRARGAGSRNDDSPIAYWACIRPEDIRIGDPDGRAGASEDTRLVGTVVEERELGFTISLRFAVDTAAAPVELWVDVSVQAHRSLRTLQRTRWELSIPSDAIHLIPR
jgi:molybdate transport system ATP-binding protein